MNQPILAAQQLIIACLLGILLGLLYGFLRPLRPKYTALADFVFLLIAGWVWLYLGFAVCKGDLRLGYSAGLFAGGILWELTLGRVLRPVFSCFWHWIGKFIKLIFLPYGLILKKIKKIAKFLLAIGKKAGTITVNNYRYERKKTGGSDYGRQKKFIRPHSAGISPQLHAAQVRGADSYRIVYGVPDGPAERHSRAKGKGRRAVQSGSSIGAGESKAEI